MGHLVRVEPSGRQFDADPGESLMAAANRCGLRWPTLCEGKGTCTLCQCQVLEGAEHLSAVGPWESEHLQLVMGRFPGAGNGGVRLACQARVDGPVVVRKAGVRPRS